MHYRYVVRKIGFLLQFTPVSTPKHPFENYMSSASPSSIFKKGLEEVKLKQNDCIHKWKLVWKGWTQTSSKEAQMIGTSFTSTTYKWGLRSLAHRFYTDVRFEGYNNFSFYVSTKECLFLHCINRTIYVILQFLL